MIEPAGQCGAGGLFDVKEFEAHADTGFDDADHGQCLYGFALALEDDAGAGLQGKGLASADEAAAERDVGSDAFGAGAGFEIEDFRVGGEGITDGVSAVAEAYFVRRPVGRSIVHEN